MINELQDVIKMSPHNKAPRPTQISNEMLYQLPEIAFSSLLNIMNACLQLECVPKGLLRSNIWPVLKCMHYNNDLNCTRPITLIEHTRKLFTKILTVHLTTKLAQYEILSLCNSAILPYQSIQNNISILNYIFEDISKNNKELRMVLQDISKAFDTIYIPILAKAIRYICLLENLFQL